MMIIIIITIIMIPEQNGETAIMYASYYGHIDIVLALINANAIVNDKNRLIFIL
jgi:ankyrin repeat protein